MNRWKSILQSRQRASESTKIIDQVSPYKVLGRPLITEKAYKQVENKNIYTFVVNSKANKNDVKAALEVIYNVTPLSVRIVNVKQKGRFRRSIVRRSFRKAIVTLAEKDTIELAA